MCLFLSAAWLKSDYEPLNTAITKIIRASTFYKKIFRCKLLICIPPVSSTFHLNWFWRKQNISNGKFEEHFYKYFWLMKTLLDYWFTSWFNQAKMKSIVSFIDSFCRRSTKKLAQTSIFSKLPEGFIRIKSDKYWPCVVIQTYRFVLYGHFLYGHFFFFKIAAQHLLNR